MQEVVFAMEDTKSLKEDQAISAANEPTISLHAIIEL